MTAKCTGTRYTLDAVCESYNDLLDLKAWRLSFGSTKTDFPERMFQKSLTFLGTALVDLAADSSTREVAVERAAAALTAPAYMWVNLERPDWPSPLHSNLLLWWGSDVIRFEPHGSDPSHHRHAACGFRFYYDPASLDDAISRVLSVSGLCGNGTDFTYRGADARYPVLGQTFSTNDGINNERPRMPGRAFKRSGLIDSEGDNFCGMWTLLFLARSLSTSPEDAFASLSFSSSGDGGAEANGGAAADTIASFILDTHKLYSDDIARMKADPEWAEFV
jgi:hypothetical protein